MSGSDEDGEGTDGETEDRQAEVECGMIGKFELEDSLLGGRRRIVIVEGIEKRLVVTGDCLY